MECQRERSGLFTTLKQVLKAQGIQYKQLAELMDLSEPTVKRMFQDQDCKLSRLMEICQHLGLSMTELMEIEQSRSTHISQLPLETEQALAKDPGLVSCFMLLISQFDTREIAYYNQLKEADVYLYLRELEKLELVRLGKNNSVHLLVAKPVKWRLGGPLHKTLVRVNQGFVQDTMDSHQQEYSTFYSTSRLLSPQSIERLSGEVTELYDNFQKQATLDQLYFPIDQLRPYKMLLVMAPFDLRKYFPVPNFMASDRKG